MNFFRRKQKKSYFGLYRKIIFETLKYKRKLLDDDEGRFKFFKFLLSSWSFERRGFEEN